MGPRPGDELAQLARLGRAMAGRAAHFKLPYGIERAQLVPTARVLTEEFGFRLRAPSPEIERSWRNATPLRWDGGAVVRP